MAQTESRGSAKMEASEPGQYQLAKATVPGDSRSGRKEVQSNYLAEGYASWYGQAFQGRSTANGERFDMHALTAAHRTLPMPSVVRVTNLENGQNLEVRVNDRGPFHKRRIIDLSLEAARRLDFVDKGSVKVRVELLPEKSRLLQHWALRGNSKVQTSKSKEPKADGSTKKASETSVSGSYVQAAAFFIRDNAEQAGQYLQNIASVLLDHMEMDGVPYYRVLVGPAETEKGAKQLLSAVRRKGFPKASLAE